MIPIRFLFFAWFTLPVIILTSAGCSRPAPEEPGRVHYEEMGCSVVIPDGWSVSTYPATVVVYAPGAEESEVLPASFTITVDVLPEKMQLGKFVEQVMDESRGQYSNFEVTLETDVTLGKRKAKMIEFGYILPTGEVRAVAYALLKGKRGYLLTYLANSEEFAVHRITAEKAIQSFRLR